MQRFHLKLILLLAVLSLVSSAFGQRTSGARAKASKAAQMEAQRAADEDAIRKMPDPGADIAFVVALKASLREEPLASSRILRVVERGEALSLVEREPTGDWYHVIHVESAIEGWIHESAVINKLTANRYTAPDFQEERASDYANPTIKITNQEEHTDLNLKMNGVLYVVKANTTRTFTLSPGPYEYYGWSPGVRATFGKSTLSRGIVYSWVFFISRR